MEATPLEIKVEGKSVMVPSVQLENRTVICTGKRLKVASIRDEELVEGEPVHEPETFIRLLKMAPLHADLFSFAQPLEDPKPRHAYFCEWDNAAVIPITDYQNWLARLSQETRRNVKRAAKSGLALQPAKLDDQLVRGILEIYNETPIRQGRPFWHYGKPFEIVKKELLTYLDRSEFITATFQGELVGFIKMTYVNRSAHILHILSKEAHADKRPTNALIAKAVEICAAKGLAHFVYCKYVYGNDDKSLLTEFKRRNGFERLSYARYFVPLTFAGQLALQLNLHHGVKNLVPKRCFWIASCVRRTFSKKLLLGHGWKRKGTGVGYAGS